MTKYGGAQVGFLLVDGYDILGYSTELETNAEAILEESHTLGDGWREQSFVGLRQFTLSQKGFYDDAANGANDALVGSVGSNRILCVGLEGNTLGKKFVGFEGPAQANYRRAASRGVLHKADANFQGSGAVDEGVILEPHQAVSGASGDGTAVDNTASSANGGVGYLQVSAVTLGGSTSVTIKIRHSVDNSTYADLVTFANATTRTAERKTVAGTVNRYLRRNHTFNGAGAGQSVTFMLGFKRNS